MKNHLKSRADRLRTLVRVMTVTLCALIVSVSITSDWLVGGAPGLGRLQLAGVLFGVVIGLQTFLPIHWNARGLIAVMGLLLGVVLAEIATRVICGNRFAPICVPDEELIYRPIPGAERQQLRFNSRGFRGPELRDDAEGRVVICGDSFIEASYSDEESSFVGHVQRLYPGLDVVNAGVSGWGPDQSLLRMQALLPQLDTDVIVLGVFAGNDFGDLLRNRIYQKVEDKFQPGPIVLSDLLMREYTRRHHWPHLFHLISEIQQQQQFHRVNHRDHWLGVCRHEYRAWQNKDPVILGSDHYEWDIATSPDSPSATLKHELMKAVIVDFHNLCLQYSIHFVVLIIPYEQDVTQTDEDLESSAQRDPRRLTRWIKEICDDEQIEAIDLYDVFRRSTDSLYLQDGHWNERGQQLAAKVLAGHSSMGRFRRPPAAGSSR